MDRSEDKLAQAFQALSAKSPQNAPAEVGLTLHKAFRKAESAARVVSQFTSLASYDPAFSKDGFKIVRVGLSSAELSQMGAPSYVYPAGRRVLTDVVLDRDGIPVAVRTVGR